MVSPNVLADTHAYWLTLVDHAEYTIGGEAKTATIYKSSLVGSEIRFYLLIPLLDQGTITYVKLVKADGSLFADSDASIQKIMGKTLLVAFKMQINSI